MKRIAIDVKKEDERVPYYGGADGQHWADADNGHSQRCTTVGDGPKEVVAMRQNNGKRNT